jgi:hypothetical protein
MASKKFPLGTTVYYIEQLGKSDTSSTICAEIEKNYESLTFATSENQSGSKLQLLIALMHAAGAVKTEGWIWKTRKVTDFNKSVLKLLKDLILIDASLWSLLKKKYPVQRLDVMNLGDHVLSENADAFEFIQFLTMNPTYSDYTAFVTQSNARKLVTDYLTKKKQEDITVNKYEPELADSPHKNKKRGRQEDEIVDEEESPLRKRRKTAESNNNNNNSNTNTTVKGVWYWNGDSSKNSQQDIWIQYEDEVSDKIEKAFLKKQKTMKLDDERYLDLEHMLQRRYDDTSKRRAIKREVPQLSNGQAELLLSEGADN